ncbi:hypothetical protein LMG22037_06440 [Paraburkholderia phenoliruptrix]|uniref:Antitoxin Xre/MbcA/ParS-like toxin-binding domain-containing protein n=1 Tax=Paraburkholderia phenoliruptrix TaxID=252970 RepID=A0A6J5CLU0_9BURK|nr:hypothetical protein [Paraburkholderia phenoliruptrix]CAB3740989.1 hypothetical protein LMG22037_06440 [Paraburkholderia phenoliruptrix]
MLEFREKLVHEVSACICDRCGRRMTPDGPDSDWHERMSIASRGGFHSIFGDGHAISIDLCQHCVRDTLGAWLRIASTGIDDIERSPDSPSLRALRGIIRHDADDAVSVGEMNAAIAAGATAEMNRDASPDSDRPAGERRSHWEYRVIEYEEGGEIWRELREVHYVTDHGIGCSDTGACVRWTPEEGEQAGASILDRMRVALTRPVLRMSGSRREGNLRRHGADRLADPIRHSPSLRAEMEARSVAALLDGTTWLTALAVGEQDNPDDPLPSGGVIDWGREGKIFSVDLAGRTLFPGYIFDELGNPIPEVAEILKIFYDYTPIRIASWFESTNSMLHGKRPRELLATDPAAVVEAARAHAEGSIHG